MKDYSLESILKSLHRWRRPLVYGTAGVFLLSILISLLLPVYYESTTVFYAASQDLFQPKKVLGYTDQDADYYGTTDDIERILTLARSHELTTSLIEEFDLFEHYNINPDKPKADYRIREKLLDHYEIIRTKYDAIELTVEDRDPELAAALANAARDKIDSMATAIIRGSQQQIISSFATSIQGKEVALGVLYDSLNVVQTRYGILDPEAQTEFLSTLITTIETSLAGDRAKLNALEQESFPGIRDSIAILKSDISALEEQLKMLTKADSTGTSNYNIERFNRAKGKISLLQDAYRKGLNTVNIDKELLKQLKSAFDLDISAVHVVEKAEVPIVKSRPKRSLLVLASTLAAFIFLVLGVLFIESYRHVDWSFLGKW